MPDPSCIVYLEGGSRVHVAGMSAEQVAQRLTEARHPYGDHLVSLPAASGHTVWISAAHVVEVQRA